MFSLQAGVCYFIEAHVEPCRSTSIVVTSKVDCHNNSLPPNAGKLTCLLAADSPSEYHIRIKLVSVVAGSFDCHVQHGVENSLHEIARHVVTHHAPKSLFDFCDGRYLPHLNVEYPLEKLKAVGKSERKLMVNTVGFCVNLLYSYVNHFPSS